MGVLKNRVGEQSYNNQGLLMEIIQYNKAIDITVKFIDSGYVCKARYGNFQRGEVYDKFYPSVCGVGYIGNTTVQENNKRKMSYRFWCNMIYRCYGNKFNAYKDCYVCDEWLCFENFEKWFNENYYEIENTKMCLDKDILIKGNKVYSPYNCIFVPERINALFEGMNKKERKNIIGVYFNKEKQAYIPYCSNNLNSEYLGFYKTEIEAFKKYKEYKENYIKIIADEYKEYIPNKLYQALYNYTICETD